jgi:hypothetical protein
MPQGNFVPPRFEARLSFFSQYFLTIFPLDNQEERRCIFLLNIKVEHL